MPRPASVEPAPIAPLALLARLEERRGPGPNLLCFDGDGTLWSGDVSDEVFLAAVERGFLSEAARDALGDVARAHGVDPSGSANAVAARLFASHQAGRVPEQVLFETMTWCYAGHSPKSVTDFAEGVLGERRIAARLTSALEPVLTWARERDVLCLLVSASPHPIVQIPAALWGFAPEALIASRARLVGGIITTLVEPPIPYGPAKAALVRTVCPHVTWLGSFGDSGFDFELLCSAKLRVAVNPKPSLLARLGELDHAHVLVTEQEG